MTENGPERPSREEGSLGNIKEYLKRAEAACDAGDSVLAMYLYMAAFEEATSQEGSAPCEDALAGLKEAWVLACSQKERSLAEYIFERLEPYLTSDEIALCAESLHGLALDKLEEFGLSRDDLEDMAQLIQEDLGGKMELMPSLPQLKAPDLEAEEHLDYTNVAGYIEAVRAMRAMGVGLGDDPDFKKLLDMLNNLHGLPGRPAPDTLLIRADAREDANRFMMATLGELDLPTVHMRMEESIQGMPLLCVSAHAVDLPSSGSLRDVLQGGGVLVLEDLDCWVAPVAEAADDAGSFFIMQLTRGAREAVGLIRAAVESPDVHVVVTASDVSAIDGFFLDVLEPISLVDVELPSEAERYQIWEEIAQKHPSMRGIDKNDLVRLTAHMPRVDLYSAAREAVEEAYKTGLMLRRYQPVTRDNLFDKIAAYQPLESSEYEELENEVIRDFQRDLSHIDDILKD